jgi:hypothetical protein
LLTERDSGLPPRPPTEVLRTCVASDDERALTLAALAASTGLNSGLARSKRTRKVFSLVCIQQRWFVLQGPPDGCNVTLQALWPAALPEQLNVLPKPAAQVQQAQPTIPQLDFLSEFLPHG